MEYPAINLISTMERRKKIGGTDFIIINCKFRDVSRLFYHLIGSHHLTFFNQAKPCYQVFLFEYITQSLIKQFHGMEMKVDIISKHLLPSVYGANIESESIKL